MFCIKDNAKKGGRGGNEKEEEDNAIRNLYGITIDKGLCLRLFKDLPITQV